MTTPSYAVLVERGRFLGYDQGSEVYELTGCYWIADEYETTDGAIFDVYPFRGDVNQLETADCEKIVFWLDRT